MAEDASAVAASAASAAATVADAAAAVAAVAAAPAAVAAPVVAAPAAVVVPAADSPEAIEAARVAALSPEAKAAEEAAKAKPAAPEKYEDFKAPDGFTVDAKSAAAFKVWAKSEGLSQADAQTAYEGYVKERQAGNVTAVNTLAQQVGERWLGESKSDAEFGGDKFDENLAVAKRGLDAFTTPAFTKFLNDSRLGNHPEMIRTFIKIGKLVGPDGKHVASSTTPGGAVVSPEEKLWPTKK